MPVSSIRSTAESLVDTVPTSYSTSRMVGLYSTIVAKSSDEVFFPLARITLHLFSLNPLAHVRRAILQLDAVRFAAPEKPDRVPIHESQVLQVQDDVAASRWTLS